MKKVDRPSVCLSVKYIDRGYADALSVTTWHKHSAENIPIERAMIPPISPQHIPEETQGRKQADNYNNKHVISCQIQGAAQAGSHRGVSEINILSEAPSSTIYIHVLSVVTPLALAVLVIGISLIELLRVVDRVDLYWARTLSSRLEREKGLASQPPVRRLTPLLDGV